MAGCGPVEGIFSVWMAENADGSGRGIIIQHDPDNDESYTVCLEPAHGVVEAGLRGWSLSDVELALRFIDDAAEQLQLHDVDGWLRFHLAVKPAVRRQLRTGLAHLLQPST